MAYRDDGSHWCGVDRPTRELAELDADGWRDGTRVAIESRQVITTAWALTPQPDRPSPAVPAPARPGDGGPGTARLTWQQAVGHALGLTIGGEAGLLDHILDDALVEQGYEVVDRRADVDGPAAGAPNAPDTNAHQPPRLGMPWGPAMERLYGAYLAIDQAIGDEEPTVQQVIAYISDTEVDVPTEGKAVADTDVHSQEGPNTRIVAGGIELPAELVNARVRIWFCPERDSHEPRNFVRWEGDIATCQVCGLTSLHGQPPTEPPDA